VSCHKCYVKILIILPLLYNLLVDFFSVCQLNYIIIVLIAYKLVHYQKRHFLFASQLRNLLEYQASYETEMNQIGSLKKIA